MSSVFKNLFTLLGLAVVAVLGYYLFVMQKDSNTTLDSDVTIGEAKLASEQFIRELNELSKFELSDAVFADPRFRSFVDFTKPVPPQPLGRDNPFAPVD